MRRKRFLFLFTSLVLFLAPVIMNAAKIDSQEKPPLPSDIVQLLTTARSASTPEDKVYWPPELSSAADAVSGGAYDVSELTQHIRQHPTLSSRFAMVLLRSCAPKEYGSLSDGTKAAVLADLGPSIMAKLTAREIRRHPDFEAEDQAMVLTNAARAFLELDPWQTLPLLRDRLIDCSPMYPTQAKNLFTAGNYAWWLTRRAMGEKAGLGTFKKRWELFQRLPSLVPVSTGKPVPKAIIVAMVTEASEGVAFRHSSQMWRLFDSDYEYSAIPEIISKAPDYTSFHLLMALRSRDLHRYWQIPPAIRALVVASALEKAEDLFDWTSIEVDMAGDVVPPRLPRHEDVGRWVSSKISIEGDDTYPDVYLRGCHYPVVALAECGKDALGSISKAKARLLSRTYHGAEDRRQRLRVVLAVHCLVQAEYIIKAGAKFGWIPMLIP